MCCNYPSNYFTLFKSLFTSFSDIWQYSAIFQIVSKKWEMSLNPIVTSLFLPSFLWQLVKTVELTGLTSSASRLQYLVSDYSQDGRVFVYASDAASRAILVYDVTLGRGYRVVLPQAVAMGTTRRDVLYLALLRRSDGSTCLIFTYLSSSRLFSIRTEHLRSGSANGKIHDLGMKPKKMIFLGTDNGSALFFRYEGEPDVYRWDAVNPFVSRCFDKVYTSAECSLVTHVVADYARGRMRVLESNFPDYMQDSVGCGATQALNVMWCWES